MPARTPLRLVTIGLVGAALALLGPAGVEDAVASEEDRFYLRTANASGNADIEFTYGRPDDDAVIGDWDGNGTQTVGVRRGNRFLLRNSNSGGFASRDFRFGRSGDVPLIGDWDGDGVDTVGVRRGNRFFLRNSNSDGFADRDFRFGRSDDVPLTGDWTGNGTTTVGVRRLPPPPRVVSTFTTPLESGAARSVNIRRALELIDGDVIAPGATYSLDQAIGPRTSARGFLTNGFISDGELTSVLGGGVSQSAVTFLNAAWFAGIDIVSFRPHSIYFTRYPMCREATISRNRIDLVVRNDSPYPITVDTASTATSATVRFVSRPWARVRSSIGAPTNIVGGVGGAFTVSCSRTITYPDGRSTTENYRWRYSQGYPG